MIQPNSLHEEQPHMLDIIIVFTCLSQYLAPTTLRQLHRVTEAMLSMTGRVTMKGLSRWTDQGGSYRTVQRFFNTSISWCKLQWVLIRHHLLEPDDVIVMGGDEVVVTGIHVKRDSWVSVMYAEELNSGQSSVTLQRTDRHGSMGQKSADFQLSL